jgi:hypothetical protein
MVALSLLNQSTSSPPPGPQLQAAAVLEAARCANQDQLAKAQAQAAAIHHNAAREVTRLLAAAEAATAERWRAAEQEVQALLAHAEPAEPGRPAGPRFMPLRGSTLGTPPAVPTPLRAVDMDVPVTAARWPAGEDPPEEAEDVPGLLTERAMIGGVELLVGPFTKFTDLASLMSALRALPGVRSVATQRFVKGIAHLRLRYEDPVPLAARLKGLRAFGPRIVACGPARIEMRVQLDAGPAASGERSGERSSERITDAAA